MCNKNITTILNISWFIIIIVGGSTGILLATTSTDIAVHDTYYVIEHIHLVSWLGTLLSLQLTILQHNQYYTSVTYMN